jgi:murein DD-endopeptidase MepM/ murein hydrolase activator NlpD
VNTRPRLGRAIARFARAATKDGRAASLDGHLSEIGGKIGDVVKIGQVIGEVGSTGRSTSPHLHYETRIDPQKFLRAACGSARARALTR